MRNCFFLCSALISRIYPKPKLVWLCHIRWIVNKYCSSLGERMAATMYVKRWSFEHMITFTYPARVAEKCP